MFENKLEQSLIFLLLGGGIIVLLIRPWDYTNIIPTIYIFKFESQDHNLRGYELNRIDVVNIFRGKYEK